jgi:hypothetical protein
MTAAPGQDDTAALQKALHRLEALTAALDRVADSEAREAARELLELTLDLHGLALARLTAIIAAADNSAMLLDAMATDPRTCAVLLLHGLHPHDAKTRLQRAIAGRQSGWAERGFAVDVLGVGVSDARVRLYKYDGSEAPAELRREVEEALCEAAPDLDDITVEVEIAGAARRVAGDAVIVSAAALQVG